MARAAEDAARKSGDRAKLRELQEATKKAEAAAQKQNDLVKQREIESQRAEKAAKDAEAKRLADAKTAETTAQERAAQEKAAQMRLAEQAVAEKAAEEKKVAAEKAKAERIAKESAIAAKAIQARKEVQGSDGLWKGSYACRGFTVPTFFAQKAYNVSTVLFAGFVWDIEVLIENNTAILHFANDKATDDWKGTIAGKDLSATGVGRDKKDPTASWVTTASGTFDGNSFSGRSEIWTPDQAYRLSSCTLKLARQ